MDASSPTATATSSSSSSSIAQELVAGALGAIVAIVCALPPLLHLVTFWLGPFIGGFVAANKANPGGRGRAIIAVTIGTGLSGLIGSAAFILRSFMSKDELPSWFPGSGMLGAILAGVWVYATVLAMIGTVVSTSLSKKRASSAAS